MGRAGAGGAGGHHSSGGGHRAGRSSGGHRVGGSGGSHHRAGSGSFGGGFGGGFGSGPSRPSRPSHRPPMGGPGMPPPPPPMRGPGMPPPPPPRGGYGYRRTYHGGNGMGCGGTIATLISLVIVCALLFFGYQVINRGDGYYGSSSTTSTIERTKLDTKNAYINDCIVDELGWFENTSRTGGRLQEFWKETGVQPYIILKAYDPNLETDDQKTEWAEEYYDSHFDTENIFLYVYFGELDADNDVGYMTYVNGAQTSSVMDSEALEIFWNNIDKNWYSDMSTDDLFVDTFNSTGKTIMKVHRSKADVVKWVIILAVVGVAGVTVVTLVKQKNKRAKEKAEEERRILETPIHDMAQNDLESKYLQK